MCALFLETAFSALLLYFRTSLGSVGWGLDYFRTSEYCCRDCCQGKLFNASLLCMFSEF